MKIFGKEIKNQFLYNLVTRYTHKNMVTYDLGFGDFKVKHNKELLEIELLQCQQLAYSEENLAFVRTQIAEMFLKGMITPAYVKTRGVTFEGVFNE